MKTFIYLPILLMIAMSGCSQAPARPTEKNKVKVGGSCEGCEAIYESPEPLEKLNNMVWLPDWNGQGKKLAVNGIVYKPDGTPAAGVIIYIYHTDQTGHYPTKADEKGWG
jgi:protocatechuate 3,4-dioxygenase beta subunit